MICIYTGDDSSFCTCSTCGARRSPQQSGKPEMVELLRGVPGKHGPGYRRPCPTGIPGSLDGVVPYQPSRCASGCTCCAWCRREEKPGEPQRCTCALRYNWSSCERDHSDLVECAGGCKPRPIAKAIVVARPGRLQRALDRIRRWLVKHRAIE